MSQKLSVPLNDYRYASTAEVARFPNGALLQETTVTRIAQQLNLYAKVLGFEEITADEKTQSLIFQKDKFEIPRE